MNLAEVRGGSTRALGIVSVARRIAAGGVRGRPMFASGESVTALTYMFVLASKMAHFQTCDGHLGVLSWKVPFQVLSSCP